MFKSKVAKYILVLMTTWMVTNKNIHAVAKTPLSLET
jgi:hypothetical protein